MADFDAQFSAPYTSPWVRRVEHFKDLRHADYPGRVLPEVWRASLFVQRAGMPDAVVACAWSNVSADEATARLDEVLRKHAEAQAATEDAMFMERA